jgi:hypothetical protein
MLAFTSNPEPLWFVATVIHQPKDRSVETFFHKLFGSLRSPNSWATTPSSVLGLLPAKRSPDTIERWASIMYHILKASGKLESLPPGFVKMETMV